MFFLVDEKYVAHLNCNEGQSTIVRPELSVVWRVLLCVFFFLLFLGESPFVGQQCCISVMTATCMVTQRKALTCISTLLTLLNIREAFCTSDYTADICMNDVGGRQRSVGVSLCAGPEARRCYQIRLSHHLRLRCEAHQISAS